MKNGGINLFWKIVIAQLIGFQQIFLVIDVWSEALCMYWKGKEA